MAMEEEKRSSSEYKKGLWTVEEDRVLMDYIRVHGKGKWNRIPKLTGLKRCGKSCRLRWMNYLSPGVKRGDFSEEENDLIIRLHNLLGNRWSLIAGRVPGRTDNQVKNHWNTHLSKKLGIKKQLARKSNKVTTHASSKSNSHISATELRKKKNNNTNSDRANSTLVVVDHLDGSSSDHVLSQIKQGSAADGEGESQAATIDHGLKGTTSATHHHHDYSISCFNNNVMDFFDDPFLDFVWHGAL